MDYRADGEDGRGVGSIRGSECLGVYAYPAVSEAAQQLVPVEDAEPNINSHAIIKVQEGGIDSTKNPGLNGNPRLTTCGNKELRTDSPFNSITADTLGKGSVQAASDEPFWEALTSKIKNLHAIISGHGKFCNLKPRTTTLSWWRANAFAPKTMETSGALAKTTRTWSSALTSIPGKLGSVSKHKSHTDTPALQIRWIRQGRVGVWCPQLHIQQPGS
jgi:hypothetical protein